MVSYTDLIFIFCITLLPCSVYSACPPNENSVMHGSACEGTCSHPHPNCSPASKIIMTCVCRPGYVRALNGRCIRIFQCPVVHSTNENRRNYCRDPNEKYTGVGSMCEGTCSNPRPHCKPHQRIVNKCVCKSGYVRSYGKCILPVQCPQIHTVDKETHGRPICSDNEKLVVCGDICETTCDGPYHVCRPCKGIQCECKKGFSRSIRGNCLPSDQCRSRTNELSHRQETKNCPMPHESYSECGSSCPPTCTHPDMVCRPVCVAGCTCERGYFRTRYGTCVRMSHCPPPLFPDE